MPLSAAEYALQNAEKAVLLLAKREGLVFTEEQICRIARDLLQISYSHGGGCSLEILYKFGEGYFLKKLYLK